MRNPFRSRGPLSRFSHMSNDAFERAGVTTPSTSRPMLRPESLDELERFADIVESIADPMVVYDAQWRVRFENAAAIRTFLRDGHERSMLGRTLWAEYP